MTKSKTMRIAPDKLKEVLKIPLQFNNNIQYPSKETHLGIARTDDGRSIEMFKERIWIGRHTFYALMGAGLHNVNGISPQHGCNQSNAFGWQVPPFSKQVCQQKQLMECPICLSGPETMTHFVLPCQQF